jgi:hypothetical protein
MGIDIAGPVSSTLEVPVSSRLFSLPLVAEGITVVLRASFTVLWYATSLDSRPVEIDQ